jgi:hypothetical protein
MRPSVPVHTSGPASGADDLSEPAGEFASGGRALGSNVFGTMLISVGVLVFIGGLVAAIRGRVAALEAKRILATPSRIADLLPRGQPVRISGTVAEAGEGTLVAPCTGANAVWFRVRLLRNAGMAAAGSEGSAPMWIAAEGEQRAVPFVVDDGSGRVAYVISVSRTLVASTVVRNLSTEAVDRVARLFTGKGVDNWISDAYEEQCVRIGDRVVVDGVADEDAGDPGPVVANPEFAHRSLRNAHVGQVVTGIGVCTVILGIVARLAGWEWTP